MMPVMIPGVLTRWPWHRGTSKGFTVTEVVAYIGLTTLAAAILVGGLFQAFGITRHWSDDVKATQNLRQAAALFAYDSLNASGTDLVSGGAPSSSVSMDWLDSDGGYHITSYTLAGNDLVRTLDGTAHVVSRRVVSAGFSLSDQTLYLDLEVQAEQNKTETVQIQTYLRMLQ